MQTEWILCPVCGDKTRDRLREDTILKSYYCPKCKHETLTEAENLKVTDVCCVPVSHANILTHSAFQTVCAVF